MLKTKKRLLSDIILVLCILFLACVFFVIFNVFVQNGTYAVVKIDGKVLGRYPLDKDGTFTLNGGTNTIEVINKSVHMTRANCPDRICIHQGKIKYKGQCITCLPNKLTVTIESKNSYADIVI